MWPRLSGNAELLLPAMKHLQDVTLATRRADESRHRQNRPHSFDGRHPGHRRTGSGGWAAQIELAIERIESTLPRIAELAIGGTAVGTGINADATFGGRVAADARRVTGFPFIEARQSLRRAGNAMDTAAELSGQLKAYAVGLMKIANDMR